jgi:hypothetical protein
VQIVKALACVFTGAGLLGCLFLLSIEERLRETPATRGQRARTELANFAVALEVYNLDVGELPTTTQGLGALRRNPGINGWHGPTFRLTCHLIHGIGITSTAAYQMVWPRFRRPVPQTG